MDTRDTGARASNSGGGVLESRTPVPLVMSWGLAPPEERQLNVTVCEWLFVVDVVTDTRVPPRIETTSAPVKVMVCP